MRRTLLIEPGMPKKGNGCNSPSNGNVYIFKRVLNYYVKQFEVILNVYMRNLIVHIATCVNLTFVDCHGAYNLHPLHMWFRHS